MIILAMFVGFFAGGNFVICVKDIQNRGYADNISILSATLGILFMILLAATTWHNGC